MQPEIKKLNTSIEELNIIISGLLVAQKNHNLPLFKELKDGLANLNNALIEVKDSQNSDKEEYFASVDKLVTDLNNKVKEVQDIIPTLKDGEDYVLTEKDKQEIAKSITVPVVEKVIEKTERVEVIREQPIITNEIKEVALYETPQEIVTKLGSLKDEDRLDVKAIKGIDKLIEKLRQSTVYSGGVRLLSSLFDTSIVTPTNGQVLTYNTTNQKWENQTPAGGGGAVDSVNGQTGVVVLDADDISDATTTNKFSTTAEKNKLGFISVTQAVDLDTMESDIAGKENTSNKNLGNTGYAGLQDFSGLGYSGILRLFGYDQHNPQEQMDGWHVKMTDPTSAEDNTAGYMLYDKIINTVNSTIWLATSVGTGTATWQQISISDITSKEDVANKNAVGGYLGLENSIIPLRLYTNALADNPLTQTDGIHRRTIAPTVTDDSANGYVREDIWITSAGIWVCTDDTTGAAVWTQTSSGGGGSGLTQPQILTRLSFRI